MKTALIIVLLLGATTLVAHGQARGKPGSITGTVVNENGQPLPNVVIFARRFGPLGTVPMATTDSEGKFDLSGLEPTTYQLFTRLGAYTPQRDENTPNSYHIGDTVRLVLVKGGVITGTVTTQNGEPVVGVRVRATTIPNGEIAQERITDDRGVYRIYGLPTGKYVVWAGGGGGANTSTDPFDADVPTYSPSSTRDTANEVSVQTGDETTNVDIRYRGDTGHAVTGTISNLPGGPTGAIVSLTSSGNAGAQVNITSYQPLGSSGFSFYGVDDGEYMITARTFLPTSEWSVSTPKRISVRGSDVTGVELSLIPLTSISGQIVLEELKTKECTTKEPPLLTETLVSAWHKQDEAAKAQPNFLWGLGAPVSANAQGGVTLRNLAPGEYYFVTRFAAKTWYLQSISISSAKKDVDASRVWTTVKSGERITGLKITLAEGAATLAGQVELSEGELLPEKLFVYLVPAEKEKSDEVLRFYGSPVTPEGKITLNNLAPGRYWLLARPSLEGGLTKLRIPDETDIRAKLRREAEAGKTEIELKPCQNIINYQLKLTN
ncbi:MAG TPA: carboxypeptidase-like regulatory domain-containing protein [Pyrinomonadaceae bacterium]|nr:carboxypeptidase-like regulatory domain-containing protein [Pyrinomonadaceae bacterium]